jgi:hypothetical protein
MLELEIKAQKATSMQHNWLQDDTAYKLYEEIYNGIVQDQQTIFKITYYGDIGYALAQYLMSSKSKERAQNEDAFSLAYLLISKGVFENPTNKILHKTKLMLEIKMQNEFLSLIDKHLSEQELESTEISDRVKLADYWVDQQYMEQEVLLEEEFEKIQSQVNEANLLSCVKQGRSFHLQLYKKLIQRIIINKEPLNL